MSDDIYDKPGGSVIQVADVATEIHGGIVQQQLCQNEEVAITRLQLKQSEVLPSRHAANDRFYVVLKGHITISGDDMTRHDLAEECLVAIPQDTDAGQRVTAGADGAVLLELRMLKPMQDSLASKQGVWVDQKVLLVDKQQVNAYEPDKHTNTVNHCLFLNEDVEVLISCIEVGGSADTHMHPTQEQYTYVANPEPSKVLHYPKGVVHGGITDLPVRHDLVVIYTPPYYRVV